MTNENIFRTAISGFNKNDVISFITELNNENEAQRAEYEKRIKEMREFIDQREAEVSELKAEAERFQKELRETKAKADYAECELELFKARVASYDNEVAVYEAKISELTLSLTQLTAAKDDFLSNKSLYIEKIDQLNEQLAKKDFALDELIKENNKLKSDASIISAQIEEYEKAREQQKEVKAEETENIITTAEEDALLKRIDELSNLLDLKQAELELSKNQNRSYSLEFERVQSEFTSKIAYLEDKLARAEQNARTNDDFNSRAILEVANIIKDARNRADAIVNDTIKNVDDTKMVVVNLKDSVSGASSVVGDAMARIVNVFSLLSKAIENAENELINSKNDF